MYEKIPNRKKIYNEQFNLCEAKTILDDIIKFMNSQANNKSPGNNALTAEFYKHFTSELIPVLFYVYDSWGKLGTMGVTSRTGIISVIYKKVIKKISQTTDLYTTILKNQQQKTLDTIIGENQSAAIKI